MSLLFPGKDSANLSGTWTTDPLLGHRIQAAISYMLANTLLHVSVYIVHVCLFMTLLALSLYPSTFYFFANHNQGNP